ncbi:MAG: phage portal protein [Frankiaceae bacterium]|nr:phage portal protein [Frankiaceae bacterium]
MGVIVQALSQMLTTGLGTFWPQDWNAASATPRETINVDATSALGVPAYYAGVRVLAESVASLPLIVYRRGEKGAKDRAVDHPMYALLHDLPNAEMTSFTYRETAMGHLVGWGNHYAEKQINALGQTVALWPLRPDRMTVLRGIETDAMARNPLVYRYRLPGGTTKDLPEDRVFHVRGLGYDGLVGYSPIALMRRALYLSLAAEEFGKRVFENDARPGVVMTHPKTLSDTARTNLEQSWIRNHEGLSNAQRLAVLEEGVTVTEIGFPPEDTQFLETRKFQVREIARALRLPPHKIGDLEQATFSNIEQQAIDFVVDSLMPWLVRWEQQIGKDIIKHPTFFAEFLVDGLLRGDSLARSQALWIQRQAGVINADEWRAIENRNPLPDGDGEVFLQPLNMTTVGQPPAGAAPDLIKPSSGVPNPDAGPAATPALTVVKSAAIPNPGIPDPFVGLAGIGQPEEPSKNGHEKVGAR